MDGLRIEEEPLSRLDEHGRVSMAFLVESALAVTTPEDGLGGIRLHEVPVEAPWVKDYDAIDGEGPTRWSKSFDLSNWGLLAAYRGAERVGGAVIAFDTPGVDMLEGRSDLAVLWDLRVVPELRGQGVGSALFGRVEDWSRERQCRVLKIETQNVNLPACRFYARCGCSLGAIDRRAYPELPGEIQLLWFKELGGPTEPRP